MQEFNDPRPVDLTLGDARRLFAVLCTGTFMPSMFGEVRDLMQLLDLKFGEVSEEEKQESDD